MELIIKIAISIEESIHDQFGLQIEIEGYDDSVIQYHLGIMFEGGLINAIDGSTLEEVCYLPTGLTWKGHDFLDAIRDEKVMNKAKKFAKEKGFQLFDLPFDVLKEFSSQILRGILMSNQ